MYTECPISNDGNFMCIPTSKSSSNLSYMQMKFFKMNVGGTAFSSLVEFCAPLANVQLCCSDTSTPLSLC